MIRVPKTHRLTKLEVKLLHALQKILLFDQILMPRPKPRPEAPAK